MAIDTNSKYYKTLLDKGYSASQIEQMANAVSSGQSAKDVIANTKVSTPTTTTTQTSNTVSQASNGVTNVSQSSLDKSAKAGTGYVAPIEEKTTPTLVKQDDNTKKLADKWNSYDYATQQDKLSKIKGLKEALDAKGIVSKTAPEQTTTTTTTPTTPTTKTAKTTTPKQDQWDYQDNSQARMDEIARNLNGYRQTNPGLFEDASAFYNFFIDGKGRSQDQIDYLWDYFNRVQKFGKYDNLPASKIGDMLVNGDLGDDYLNYLKSTDPQKYQEALSYRQEGEDKIKDKTSLDTIDIISGEGKDTTTSNAIEWLKSQGLFIDKDGNFIDDRTENYATDEEKQYAKDAADIIARNLDIDNTVKHTYDDLVEKYPGATKATLMAMAQDINSDLLREKENNNVELTRLQGYMNYMQQEREDRTSIGQKAIEQLQKQYGMYYEYSPEGMSELAQAQYASTNVTLDQADSGTDTQKQMALDIVLTPIYEQYGDIIERPKVQVINDVMAYAKKNGMTLSQALKGNFTDYLKQKPAYKAMQSQMADAGWDIKNIYVDGKQQSVWYNPYTQETKPLGYSYNSSSGKFDLVSMNDRGEGDYQKYREDVKKAMREWAAQGGDLEGAAQNISANMEGTYLGLNTCGYYVNDYIYGVTGVKGPFGSKIEDKRNACNNKEGLKGAKVGDAIVFDWNIAGGVTGVLPEYGHVGIITASYEDGSIDVSSSISGKVQTRRIYPGDSWYKNIYGTRSLEYSGEEYGYGENPMSSYLSELGLGDLNADQKKDLKFVTQSYNLLYRISSSGDLDHLINSGDFEKLVQNMNSKSFQSIEGDKTFSAIKSMLTKNISDQTNLKTIGDIAELITLKLRKESGAAISAGEWASGFESFLPGAGEDYSTSFAKYIRFEQDYLMPSLAYAGGDMSNYKPLFSPNSPYYKRDDSTIGLGTTGNTSKGTWDISGTTGQGSIAEVPTSQYSTLFSQLDKING